ncbi:MAG: prepilin-type N-terminal cleavage/methylation domain-containing protein [Candidatus Omnitrophica bacterium]|nr:prepilin-type N-terminal cleavage/methylation domain-containing protein [Candidatus Omnitrophota bacterium]
MIFRKKGFTLLELIVAMAILGLLAAGLLGNFMNSQRKARDAQRKSDLKQIQNALEAYFNDHNTYPSDSGGRVAGINWGESFSDGTTNYMQVLPQDPQKDSGMYYYYDQTQLGQGYRLYACLENREDKDFYPLGYGGTNCGQCLDPDNRCTYGVTSSNESL